MSAPQGTPATKHTWDSTAVTALAITCTIFLLSYVFTVLGRQTFYTHLSPAVPNGLTFDAVNNGPFAYLLAGFIIKSSSLLLAIWCMWSILARIKSGMLYTQSTARKITFTCYAILGWLFGVFVEHMGNNFAAARLNISDQWDSPTYDSSVVLVFLFLVMLYILERAIYRTIELEEEVEDTV